MRILFVKISIALMLLFFVGAFSVVVVFAVPPNPGGYLPGDTLDPECVPGHSIANTDPFDCFVTLPDSGWSLDGDAGTDGGATNFIGTTDAQDFVIKVDSDEIVRFADDGVITLGKTAVSTIWDDGSFAFNDDNFENDNPGTEQNMFYFNFGNHDGLFNNQAKRAIRLGSIKNDEWDINSANVGDRSIAIGFSGATFQEGPVALGENAVAIGTNNQAGQSSIAIGLNNTANGGFLGHQYAFGGTNQALTYQSSAFGLGNTASGEQATAFGKSSVASGDHSAVFGNIATASGNNAFALGINVEAYSFGETVIGRYNTSYVPADTLSFDLGDRLFVVGGGSNALDLSDAFTILKNGETGVGVDNFEANTNGLGMFQVGDGTTNIIGYVETGTGNWMAVSDERKKDNIRNIGYGLDTVNQLSPKSYIMKSNGQESIGFLAQDVLSIIPEAVSGSEEQGYSMAYQVITPVLVNAIQELDLKISTIEALSGVDTDSFFEKVTKLMRDTISDMTEIIVQLVKADRIETQELCVDGECFTGDDIRLLKEMINERTVDGGENHETEMEISLTPDIVHEEVKSNVIEGSSEDLMIENQNLDSDEIVENKTQEELEGSTNVEYEILEDNIEEQFSTDTSDEENISKDGEDTNTTFVNETTHESAGQKDIETVNEGSPPQSETEPTIETQTESI